jgi:hypothetical protein
MSTEQHEGIVLGRISFLFWKELEGHAVLGASEEATSRGEQYALGGVLTQGTTWPSACIFGSEMVKRWARGNEYADGRRTSLALVGGPARHFYRQFFGLVLTREE